MMSINLEPECLDAEYECGDCEYMSREIEQLKIQLKESRNNDRIAMSWLNDIRKAIDPDQNIGYDEVLEWVKEKSDG